MTNIQAPTNAPTKAPEGPKRGQRVKILRCQYDLAEHVGQVGTVASIRPGQLSVFVNFGLCRATEVGLLSSEDAVGEAEQTARYPG